MSSKKKLLENSLLYSFSSLLVKAIGFLLLPLYTTFLTPNDYGAINLANGFIQIFTFIVAFSLYSAVIRFYVDYKDDVNKLRLLYSTALYFITGSGIVFIAVSFAFKDLVIKWFFEGIGFYPIIVISVLSTVFISLHTLHQSILQGMQKGKKITIINIIVFLLTVILNIIFIVVLQLGAAGMLLSQLLVNMLYTLYLAYDLKKNGLLGFVFSFKVLKDGLRYSIPLMPHNLSTRVASFVSRLFINKSDTLSTVGLYSIGLQFGNIIDLIQISVHKAFQPWFFEKLKSEDVTQRKEAVNLSYYLLILYSLVYMTIGLFSQETVLLMTNKQYAISWTVIPILVAAYSVKSVYYFFVSVVMYYQKTTKKLFITTTIGSFFDIVLAFFLVPLLGMYGSALAFLVAKIVVVTMVVTLSIQTDDVGYKVWKMLKIVLISLGFMGIGLYFSYTRFTTVFKWENTFYKLIVFFAYIIYLYITNKKVFHMVIDKLFKQPKHKIS